jgi:alpha-L-rhamnosidase
MKLISVVFLFLCPSFIFAQSSPFKPQTKWITIGFNEDSVLRPCDIFKKELVLDKKVKEATVYISALGLYELTINGKKVSNNLFTPGFTSYNKRVQYQQYDVKDLLAKGSNKIQVTVGEGWYRGPFGNSVLSDNYGSLPALICQLHIKLKDGQTVDVSTDTTWLTSTGPILNSTIYGGEMIDSRIQSTQWWAAKLIYDKTPDLVATINKPVREAEHFQPVRILTTPRGEQVIDFGQNMSGWVDAELSGRVGDTVRLSHAETLDKNGNFYVENLRAADATDTYILSGVSKEHFKPHFTWHGFRYVMVSGCNVYENKFTAIALYSSLNKTGSFECSMPELNRLQHNIEWSLKSNLLDIPTDCPQRSERLGWTADAQVILPTAAFNFDIKDFFFKWLQDYKADQYPTGSVPAVIPDLYQRWGKYQGIAGWSDAAVIIPWQLFQQYNDTSILSAQYTSMKAWVDYIAGKSEDGIWKATGFGDWLAPKGPTSLPYIDQCYWAQSADILAKTAFILGNSADANKYGDMVKAVKASFLKHFMDTSGLTIPSTQTAYVLGLQMNMFPDSFRKKAADKLASLVKENDYHLATGFLGTPFLLHALSDNGYSDVAWKLLLQKTAPSWLYPITMGATTIWEKWDAIQPDSTILPVSLNHYAYGAVGDWLYTRVAGIQSLAPGYKKILICPNPGSELQWVKASYNSPQGKIVSNWRKADGKFSLHIEVPRGVIAYVVLPGKQSQETGSGSHDFSIDL